MSTEYGEGYNNGRKEAIKEMIAFIENEIGCYADAKSPSLDLMFLREQLKFYKDFDVPKPKWFKTKKDFRVEMKKLKPMSKDAIKLLDFYVQDKKIAKNWMAWIEGQYFEPYTEPIVNVVDLEVFAIHLSRKYNLIKKKRLSK